MSAPTLAISHCDQKLQNAHGENHRQQAGMELAIEGTRIFGIISWRWFEDPGKLAMLRSHDPEFNYYVAGSEFLKIPQGELDLNENLGPNSTN